MSTSDGPNVAALMGHLAELEKESHKSTPDLSLIERKLERTFLYRRSRVYDLELTVTDVLSEFPALRLRSCVSLIICKFVSF